MKAVTEARFWGNVELTPESDCWLWHGPQSSRHGRPNGYGVFAWNRTSTSAHRVAYELMIGVIPAGLTLDHLCRTRLCVNPWHLDPVPTRINSARSPLHPMNRTHCPAGHAYDGDNVYTNPQGRRGCHTCRRQQHSARRLAVSA